MNHPFRRVAPLFIVALFAISSAFATGERNSFDPQQFSIGAFHGCRPTGKGVRSDPYLNSLKNRDTPPSSGKLYTVSQVMNVLPTTLPKKKSDRSTWTPQQQDLAARWESRAVMVEGYLLDVRKEKEEACNCGSSTDVDHHLWLAARPTALKARSIVVEVSPRMWPGK